MWLFERQVPVTSLKSRSNDHELKPLPENFWRWTHPVLQAIRRGLKELPRNVTGYHVQELPDGCHNCSHLYCGAQPDLGCGLACRTPEKPSFCDSVNPLGKCDKWDKFLDPPSEVDPVSEPAWSTTSHLDKKAPRFCLGVGFFFCKNFFSSF